MSKISGTLLVGLANVVGIGAVAVYVGSAKNWTAMALCGAAFVVAVTLPFFLVRKSTWQGAVGLGAAGTAVAYLALSTGLWMLKLEDPTPVSLFTGALLAGCVGALTGLFCRLSVKLQLRRLAKQQAAGRFQAPQGAPHATPVSQPLQVIPPGSCAPGQCVARPGPCAPGQCVARSRTQPQAGTPAVDEPRLPLLRASAANQYRHPGAGVTPSGT